jgi:hypothetical protein
MTCAKPPASPLQRVGLGGLYGGLPSQGTAVMGPTE